MPTRISNTPTKKAESTGTSSASAKKISTPSGLKSAREMQALIEQEEKIKQIYANAKEALALVDLTRTETRTFTSYNKESLRTYLRSPKSSERELRNLSKFLYRLCYNYRKLVWYNAEMVDLTACTVIPLIDESEDVDDEAILSNYYQTLLKLQQMNLQSQILQLLLVAWREDTVYAYIYDDDETFFFHILDGEYCRVSSIDGGCLRFAFDFSYFRSHANDLDNWDSEFATKYNAYVNGTANRWQELDLERQICIKVNIDDKTMDYPPFAALFEQIIDLIDLQSIQSVKDELSIYKLLIAHLDTLTNAEASDQFKVDVDTAISYYNRLAQSLPDSVGIALSPLPIDAIEFKGDTTEDTDSIANANNNLFKNATSSEVLYSEKSNSAICEAQLISDTRTALSSVLPQIEIFTNLYLGYKMGDHAYVKYLMVSPYTKKATKDAMLASGQNGLPTKLTIASLDGFTPLETLSMLHLENDILKLQDRFVPLSTSYTQSSGAPEKDVTDLTESGLDARDNG